MSNTLRLFANLAAARLARATTSASAPRLVEVLNSLPRHGAVSVFGLPPGRHYPPHAHRCVDEPYGNYEVHVVLRGSGVLYMANAELRNAVSCMPRRAEIHDKDHWHRQPVSAGSVLILPPGVAHVMLAGETEIVALAYSYATHIGLHAPNTYPVPPEQWPQAIRK